MDANLRQRHTYSKLGKHTLPTEKKPFEDSSIISTSKRDVDTPIGRIVFSLITCLAFFTRFFKIWYPYEVVFDEVHFGKFTSYVSYLQRTYFFDVHPPFAKLAFAFVGWCIGFDGQFLFESIGDNYIQNKVPYIGLRALPAILGSLTVPLIFLIMKESGYGLLSCTLSAAFILFDNAHLAETRLILIDAMLIFFITCSFYSYIRFYKQRHDEFSREWWVWLLMTGVSLSCVISTKYVGLFTFVTIGGAVAIDLWNLLDINRGLTMASERFFKHFLARAFTLLVVPFLIYLLWFWIHFAVLTKSGPGDDFMSPEFQATLADNPMTMQAVPIQYYDTITMRHRDTKVFLHSHPDKYPLRYEDGRISSQGQQVTGYPHNDTNNFWIIVPAQVSPQEVYKDRVVKNEELIKLKHVVTSTYLLSHDVASPYFITNQEFTTIDEESAFGDRSDDATFLLKIEGGNKDTEFQSKAGPFKLLHYPSKVAMWTHPKVLPDWAFLQQEICGNKNVLQLSNIWYVEDILDLDPTRLPSDMPRKPKSIPFWKRYMELQAKMFLHNNALTGSHPYSSHPIQWPFLIRGVSFWTKESTREQVYFIGNFIGWWINVLMLAILAGIFCGDQLSTRRGLSILNSAFRTRFYNSLGFFFLAWAAHYFPFFLMGRQLFLHHYLPAHLASSLVSGALFQFLFTSTVEGPVSQRFVQGKPAVVSQRIKMPLLAYCFAALIISGLVGGFIFFAPFTYGTPGLDVDGILRRKLLDTYELHWAK
ncbi:Dolichyl-phosphate-mannose--protein mannosyltransferase 4 [Neolecta irregularis DAH-3]|uniref:Dolichyl-phosphate-mannose--protein mannosyltransferase n=1 Tax=Neolecta irregularis (strain DAH-3) TaxID=1198029 RepID=A0A1U7LQD9_NEOID|nr:Dolichyl-phosphate-mannose--protein mannosyltransferase 4 [Neolecta irregularis DAH-3]|eukprot:OLL24886.1 Dolichyl-phosphate-mannose--protein mannosyltransferase 4 [Neolecta irregularis DAH-3]